MKKRFIKIFAALMVLSLIFSSLTLSAKSAVKDWIWEDDSYNVIVDENHTRYIKTSLPYGCEIVGTMLIIYNNEISYPDIYERDIYYLYSVYSIKDDLRVISLDLKDDMVYVREDYISSFNEFLYGDAGYKYLFNRGKDKSVPLGNNVLDLILDSKEKCTIDVREFDSEYYLVYNCDDTGFFGMATHTILRKGEDYYYAINSELDNSNFDADGNLSLRKGTIDVYKIDSEMAKYISLSVYEMRYNYRDITFEYDELETIITGDRTGSLASFLAAMIVSGFIFPMCTFIFGLILTIKNRKNKNKSWIILPILSVIWMAAATVILIILI